MRIPQAAERLKEAPAQALRAVLSKTALPKDVPAQQALRAVLSKEAPAQALRAVFSGVGQILLVTERVRRRAMGDVRDDKAVPAAPAAGGTTAVAEAAPTATEAGAGTVPAETAAPAAKMAEPEAPAARADRKTMPNKPRTSKASPAKASSSAAKPSTAKASAPKASTAKNAPAKTGSAKAATAAAPKAPAAEPAGTPPIPRYSELSVASLRARMRGLDAAQLRELISYERGHEDRETVIAMFERRIAKLDVEGPAAG